MEDQEKKFREEVQNLTENQILNRISIFQNNIRIMKNQENQVKHEIMQYDQNIKDNNKKIQDFKQLPYLVATISEILENKN